MAAMTDEAELRNPSAPIGKSEKYARREYERRFLIEGMPSGEPEGSVTICDRYLEGTRLRLRRAVAAGAGAAGIVYKLTQKARPLHGQPELVTTVYLNEKEYERLAVLPARVLEKTRVSIPPFGIDVFAPPRAGLFLAEVEFESQEEMQRFAPPTWAVAEVTLDSRFAGGRLAETGEAELSGLLRSLGLSPKG